jgi:hypothetical protein
MIKKIFFIVIMLTTLTLFSQNSKEKKVKLKGRIIDVKTRFPLKSAHILNLNSVIGTITNRFGEFAITAKKNDVIHISYIGYESIKLTVTNDILNNDKLEIAINPKIVEIDEIKVKAHQLVGVLAIDAKNVPNSTPKRIHIDGIAQTFEVGKPRSPNYDSPLAAVFSPIDFWYQKLGKKPKELKKLKKLRKDDQLRDIMEQNFNREILLEYLSMSREELNTLLKDCNHSRRFIKKASDLQIVNAVINCYESHKTNKKGKVKKEIIHLKEANNKG